MRLPALCQLLCLALATFACKKADTTESTPPAKEEPLPSGQVSEVVKTTSIVKEIDQATRIVVLEKPDGSIVRFRAGKDVRNLDQVKVGDEVTVEYYESIAYEVKKPGSPTADTTVEGSSARAAAGEKPGGEEIQVITMTVTIVAIDATAGTVTLKDPSGALMTVKARDPKNLERVAVGDLVELTITEALAVSVTTPEK